MSETVMLPLTDLSGETVIVPFADAEVLTGGTSWSPASLTSKPCVLAAMAFAHPSPTKDVTANAMNKALIV
jgi:hypothetical protein